MREIVRAFSSLGLDCISLDIVGGEYKSTARCLSSQETAKFALGFPPEPRESNLVFAMKPEIQMRRLVAEYGMKLVGLHVGDVSEIPTEWRLIMKYEALVVVPSSWMEWVVRKAGITNVLVSRHGVQREYLDAPLAPMPPPGPPKFLHFCSSGIFPERKSTPGVLQAFQRIIREGRVAQLTLVVSELRRPLKKLLGALDGEARARVLVRCMPYGHTPDQLIALYSNHHALLCPSRSEGFGIQALEARALGIPVVQTLCTGMADHLGLDDDPRQRGIVPVQHGELVPAWGDFGLAPEVTDKAIYEGMIELIDTYDTIREAAASHADEMISWSWESQTRGLAEQLKNMDGGNDDVVGRPS
jgi:glycosyltransferase involved in cell wall biosynthesis